MRGFKAAHEEDTDEASDCGETSHCTEAGKASLGLGTTGL